jgi:hypothetical protein
LSALTCGTISLATGELSVQIDNLTLQGPGANLLTIAGSQDAKHIGVFQHTGTGTLRIDALKIIDTIDYRSSCIDSGGTVYLNRSIVSECGNGAVVANGFRSRDSTISNSYRGIHTTGGSVEIIGSTISGNSAYYFGCSALRIGDYGRHSEAPVLISSSTISGNGSSYLYYAACINQPVTINNSTIAFNSMYGLLINAPSAAIESSIIAHNLSRDLSAPATLHISGHNNLIMSAAIVPPADTITADPLLLPLADNGGPTRTHALLPGSPAIDAGSNSTGSTTDQRGAPFVRVVGAAPDIGAFESTPPTVTIDASFTGSWYDPTQSGHGLMLEVLPGNQLLALWFAFDTSGNQAWFGGVGTYSGNAAIINGVSLPSGGHWIPNFDPHALVYKPWGTLGFTFTDHDHGQVSFNSVLGYGSGSMNLTRLTSVAKQTAFRPIGPPVAVTADKAGNIYFSSSPNRIFELDSQGALRLVAGAGPPGYSGDGGPATQAQLNFPLSYPELLADPVDYSPLVGGLAFDATGRLYIADAYNNRIRRIGTDGVINTVVGTGASGNSGDGGQATSAQITWPQGVALDSASNLYFSTAYASLRKVTPAGIVSSLAGNNCGANYLGPGLCVPEQIAVDTANDVFVPDGYCRVREVRHDGSIFTVAGADTVASNGSAFTCGYSGDGGPATKAALNSPYSVAVDNSGNLFIADTSNNCIRKVNSGGIISTVAGVCNPDTSKAGYSGDGGPATSARLNLPYGIALDGAGNLLIADTENNRIRKVSANGIIDTIAGNGAGLNTVWTASGNLMNARVYHTATLLANGEVLVAGGDATGTSAELYDPATRSWSATGSLKGARSLHTATLLPDGRVLVAGGAGITCTYSCVIATAELYDPATGAWSSTASMSTPRQGHTATLLQNGKVLVVGGYGTDYLASAELYDPATGTWSTTGSLPQQRIGHAATRLLDGRVLVVGGSNDIDDGVFFATSELYDPSTGAWRDSGSMAWVRYTPVVTLLKDGRVLVAGGDGYDQRTQGVHETLSSAEIFDPANETFTAASPLVAGQEGFTASVLSDGSVLVAGGFSARAPYWASAVFPDVTTLFDPNNGQWAPAGTLRTPRAGHTATVLADGSALVAGGSGEIGASHALTSTEIFTPTLTIDASFTGNWYDPAQGGHGLMLEVLPNNQLVALWFAFSPAGDQAWFGGLGTYSGNTATITGAALPTGGKWIPNFDPNAVVRNPWGTLTFTFTDCNHGRVDFNSTVAGYGSGSMNLTRLTMPAGLTCP